MSVPETKVINYNWSLLNEAAMAEKLRAMSAKGWHLIGFKEPNYLKLWQGYGFVFEKGEPEARVYRTDYRPGSKHKIAEYVQLCEDAGWRKVFSRRGFYIFSAPADLAAHADFFSDRASRIAKLKRIRLRTLVLSMFLTPGLFYFYILLQGTTPAQSSVTPTILTAFVLYTIYVLINLSLSIRKLQRPQTDTGKHTSADDPSTTGRLKFTTELNIIAALTLIFMPISAYLLLPDWHWSLHWHIAQSAGLLAGYLVLRLFIVLRTKSLKLP